MAQTQPKTSIDFLAFGAHPDDIELGCAGTLIKLAQQGYRTAAITLTRGEAGTRGTPEIRRKEFDAAAEVMQVSVHRQLDMPDGAIEETYANKLKLVRILRELRPRVVATVHWESRHPDHIHTSHLVRDAAMIAGLKNLMAGQAEGESEHWEEPWRPNRVLYFLERYEVPLSFIVDISATFERKMQAVRGHESQFHGPNMQKYGAAQTSISRPEFLEVSEAKNRRWGAMIGAQYGEAFVVREAVRIDDPVAAFGAWCHDAFP
jgi:bacillithiol biosynthesis deacetylase BshB1